MCMEDVRIGRKSAFIETTYAIGAAAVLVVPSAGDRTALILGPPSSGTVTFSTVAPVAAGSGLTINAGGAPVILDIRSVGEAVNRGWYAIGSGAGLTGFIGQTLTQEQ